MSNPFRSVIDGQLHDNTGGAKGRVKVQTYFYELMSVGEKATKPFDSNLIKNISRYSKQTGKVFKTKATSPSQIIIWRIE